MQHLPVIKPIETPLAKAPTKQLAGYDQAAFLLKYSALLEALKSILSDYQDLRLLHTGAVRSRTTPSIDAAIAAIALAEGGANK